MTVTIDIAVDIQYPAWTDVLPDAEARCGRLAATALGAVDLPEGVVELSIVLADDATVQGLNRDWRGKDQPTNVLSFASLDDEDAPLVPGAPLLLGDVILAYETCAAEAKDQGKTLADHFGHLVVHGVLHLLGYDHMDDEEAAEMESLETTLLAALGIADPYGEQ
ncbi:Metal-dependent hydrolase YbeY involved in rRNA and/or ribosome maturation and assembly [Paramagnetospirillum magnetotacticum MS-1]|uniref:Endoribonuclease YbeY n=1 Tax=Paramagnetospirillum magnetotacticum MS-1 TaxID=272627 RepID=A0A0C2YS37_PARME|nr:rRNA maturation RNase YbeY [Paramagnetospirillum magnetotacticum]KIL97948.1 Metal-dependent hydrolase YbeY involved in rRNA and/or ribosome maturation and assembly [Paramagnetospirillum magnetotacticum MS-1]